jgi:hypothetical protein
VELKDYIQGKKRGKEANRLERKALNDPFLQEAIDGFDAVGGNHLYALNALEKELEKRIESKENRRRLWWIGIAASIVFVIGLGSLFFIRNHKPADFVAIDTTVIPPPITPTIPDASPAIAEAKTPEQKQTPVSEPEKIQRAIDNLIIKGKISDSYGEVPGASVQIKGTTKGASTDLDGNYSIAAKAGDTLVFSSIGLLAQEVAVSKKSPRTMNISLKEDNIELDEFVVVGYGVQKKSDVTGSMSSISKKQVASKRRSKKERFGEKEFKAFFEENRSTTICSGEKASISLRFYVDKTGTPTDFNVIKSTCDELEEELIELLEYGPQWTTTERKVKLRIRLKQSD